MTGSESPDSFVPLSRALEIIAAQLPRAGCDMRALACTVSVLVPLYRVEGTTRREVREAELRGAIFSRDDVIRFADRRPPIDNLAVTADGIARVIRILQGAALQMDALDG